MKSTPLGCDSTGNCRSPERRRPRGDRLVVLGRPPFAVVVVGLLLVAVVVSIVLLPQARSEYIVRYGVRSFEARYGFRTGMIAVSRSAGDADSVWGVVWVAPDGEFARLHVQTGDIPVDYHGGVYAFYDALVSAERGEAASFQVTNAADWSEGRQAVRDIQVPAYSR